MPVYHTDQALLPGGWARAVRLTVAADGRIAAIETDAPADGAERLAGPLLPGMPNLHSHAFQRAMAGLAEVAGDPQDSFWTWRELMYRLAGSVAPEQLEAIATHLYIAMLKAGYTAVAEFHYLHHAPDGQPYADPAELAQRVLAAAEHAGIGCTLLPVLYAHAGFGGQAPNPGQRRFVHAPERFLALLERLAPDVQGQPLRRLGYAFHSLRAVTPDEMNAVLAAAPAEGPIHIHIAEQQQEVDDCLAWSGQRPIAWLYDHAPVDPRWCLVHATHADAGETATMAASGAVVGICPSTEANLGDGLFPAVDFLQAGGRIGIGSDSHVSLSVVEELRWFEYGQRLRDQRRNRLHGASPAVGRTLFDAALAGGAQALGQPVGRLEAGARADFVVLDGADPFIATADGDAILNRWLFAGSDHQVRDVMVGGRWVVRERRHAHEDAAAQAFARTLRALLG